MSRRRLSSRSLSVLTKRRLPIPRLKIFRAPSLRPDAACLRSSAGYGWAASSVQFAAYGRRLPSLRASRLGNPLSSLPPSQRSSQSRNALASRRRRGCWRGHSNGGAPPCPSWAAGDGSTGDDGQGRRQFSWLSVVFAGFGPFSYLACSRPDRTACQCSERSGAASRLFAAGIGCRRSRGRAAARHSLRQGRGRDAGLCDGGDVVPRRGGSGRGARAIRSGRAI